jgi:hypothetical protein
MEIGINEPLTQLPVDIQRDWLAQVIPAEPTANGVFRLVAARRTEAASFEGQRITVLVLDENGRAMPNVPVVFSYSTAKFYTLTPDFLWRPPAPQRAFIVPTQGSGQIDQVQGDVVKAGQPGGVTVYIFTPEYSSDVATGLGMLSDHTGLHLTFQLRRVGFRSDSERLAALEQWVTNIDSRLEALEAAGG